MQTVITRRERTLDAAVRAFRDFNPVRWREGNPCLCIGCTITIRSNFAMLDRDPDLLEKAEAQHGRR